MKQELSTLAHCVCCYCCCLFCDGPCCCCCVGHLLWFGTNRGKVQHCSSSKGMPWQACGEHCLTQQAWGGVGVGGVIQCLHILLRMRLPCVFETAWVAPPIRAYVGGLQRQQQQQHTQRPRGSRSKSLHSRLVLPTPVVLVCCHTVAGGIGHNSSTTAIVTVTTGACCVRFQAPGWCRP